MIRKAQKTRKYSAPSSKETGMVLEKNFCASIVTFNVTVEELQNINKKDGTADAEPMYFEF